MTIKVKDLDKVEAWTGGAILPVGRHRVKIEAATETTSSNDNPMIELEFGNNEGTIRDWLVVIPSTYGKVKSLLDAAGIEAQGDEWEFDASVLVGRGLGIHVGEEPDTRPDADAGAMRSRVMAYLPLADVPGGSNGAAGDSEVPADDRDLPF